MQLDFELMCITAFFLYQTGFDQRIRWRCRHAWHHLNNKSENICILQQFLMGIKCLAWGRAASFFFKYFCYGSWIVFRSSIAFCPINCIIIPIYDFLYFFISLIFEYNLGFMYPSITADISFSFSLSAIFFSTCVFP